MAALSQSRHGQFLALYRSSAQEQQMAKVTPEQAQAGMEARQASAAKVGPAIVGLGAPMFACESRSARPPHAAESASRSERRTGRRVRRFCRAL
jgi:hypothetical protein